MGEGRGMTELEELLRPFVSDRKTLTLSTLQLYEAYEGCQKYLGLYENLFKLPADDLARREALADTVVEIKVLIDADLKWHMEELVKEVDRALEEVCPDD